MNKRMLKYIKPMYPKFDKIFKNMALKEKKKKMYSIGYMLEFSI